MHVEYHKKKGLYISPFMHGNMMFFFETSPVSYAPIMRLVLGVVLVLAASMTASLAPGQDVKPTTAAKATKPAKAKKVTKAIPPFTFEAHTEGTSEGAIYGEENLVSVTIDATGIRYRGKGMDKPYAIPWDQVSDWQPNNFTSYNPSSGKGGDFGIGVHQGARYFSFRTRNGRDYLAAIKTLRAFAPAKERAGIG
jgi:hypothetical protein